MDPLTTGLLVALMVASFYFLIIRPNRKRQAEQAKLTQSMQPGVRVMLSSGIYGTVTRVGERQAHVEVAPGVEVAVLKQAVLQVITPGSQFAEDGALPPADHPDMIDDAEPIDDREPIDDPDLIDDRDRIDEGDVIERDETPVVDDPVDPTPPQDPKPRTDEDPKS